MLLVASKRPSEAALARVVEEHRDNTDRLLLITYKPLPHSYHEVGVDEVHALTPTAQEHGPAFRRSARRADRPRRLLLHLEHDPWVMRHVRAGAAVVAVDSGAQFAVERIADRGNRRTRMRRLADRLPIAMARLLVAVPWIPERHRYQLAHLTIVRLQHLDRTRQATQMMRTALRHLRMLRMRADLLGDVVSHALARGQQPALAVEAYAAELAVSDQHHTAGQFRKAAESFDEASRTAFHRVLHFDRPTSPLAADPTSYIAPLASSTTALALRAPRGRTRTDRPQVHTSDKPTRLLIATRRNADFLSEIREHFENHPAFETQFVDFQDATKLTPLIEQIVEQTLTRDTSLQMVAEEVFRPYLNWADVVFVDWCTALAALITQVDPGDTRVVVRMHSYEAFTQWPHLVDFTRIDDMVFVSEHLRDLAIAAAPALQRADAPCTHVLTNAVDLHRCVRPKPAEARFALALVGASKAVKDPRWAIDVLRLLRNHDERYRLFLIGGKFQDPSAATRGYAEALRGDLAELEPSGAVQRIKFTDDMPKELENVGVILSSSVRESFHIGLVEGAASGAVPVVRDWPFFPGAARDLFPHEWVVDNPDEAADRILRLTATDEVWREAGRESSAWVVPRWDWQRVSRDYEALFSL